MADEIAVLAVFNGNRYFFFKILKIRHNIRLHAKNQNASSIPSTLRTLITFFALQYELMTTPLNRNQVENRKKNHIKQIIKFCIRFYLYSCPLKVCLVLVYKITNKGPKIKCLDNDNRYDLMYQNLQSSRLRGVI